MNFLRVVLQVVLIFAIERILTEALPRFHHESIRWFTKTGTATCSRLRNSTCYLDFERCDRLLDLEKSILKAISHKDSSEIRHIILRKTKELATIKLLQYYQKVLQTVIDSNKNRRNDWKSVQYNLLKFSEVMERPGVHSKSLNSAKFKIVGEKFWSEVFNYQNDYWRQVYYDEFFKELFKNLRHLIKLFSFLDSASCWLKNEYFLRQFVSLSLIPLFLKHKQAI